MNVPERWRFSFDDDATSLRDLSWTEAVRVFRDAEAGNLIGQADGDCVSLEFDAAHAAVLYMGRDRVILRAFFPHQPAAAQDVTPFFCGGCGIRIGNRAEYLSRFVRRSDGLGLFAAVLCGADLPSELPDPHSDQSALPGFEDVVAERTAGRVLQWRPLTPGECKHADLDAAAAGEGR